jgi:hypothetical protein
VDNTGPNPGSVNSPESRALTPNVNFGVGNVNPHIAGYPIASSSGRGPSPCDGTSIKPEVAAPGTQIYSSLPNNNYGSLTGTSMACPHTSGAVALLRQVNPDLTVDEIKTALMATALDRGAVGEDNDYGWGIIDIAAAAASVAPPLPANPPENLQASVAEDEVTLTWEEPREVSPENQLRSYLIYRAPSGEPFPGVPLAELRAIFSPPVYVDHDVPPGLWHYVVTAEYENGESGPSNEVEVETLAPSSVGLVRAADGLSLLVGPNPLVESTIIRFRSRGLGPVTLSVFDSGGRKLRTLVSGAAVPAGESAAAWDARDDAGRQVPSGVYFVRLEEAEHELQRAVTVLR